jgi:hypothetical protein
MYFAAFAANVRASPGFAPDTDESPRSSVPVMCHFISIHFL